MASTWLSVFLAMHAAVALRETLDNTAFPPGSEWFWHMGDIIGEWRVERNGKTETGNRYYADRVLSNYSLWPEQLKSCKLEGTNGRSLHFASFIGSGSDARVLEAV